MSADTTHPSTHLILADRHLREAVGYLNAVAVSPDADAATKATAKRIALDVSTLSAEVFVLRTPSLTELLGAEPAENCS